MNREERRSLKKQGVSEGTINNLGALNSPCTITEAVQIARGVAEDAITDYHRNQGNVQLSMSIQIEILKSLIFSSGMMTEEEFRQQYMEKAQELQKMQEQRVSDMMKESQVTASMEEKAGDIEVKIEQ